jgi:hypothetical protein
VVNKALPHGRRRAAFPDWGNRGPHEESHSGPAGQISSGFSRRFNYATNFTLGNFSGIELPSHVGAYGAYYPLDLGTRGIVGWLGLLYADHYDYTQNRTFLEGVTYPLLKEAASFFVDYLTYDAAADRYVRRSLRTARVRARMCGMPMRAS